jgi:hypothetical protein
MHYKKKFFFFFFIYKINFYYCSDEKNGLLNFISITLKIFTSGNSFFINPKDLCETNIYKTHSIFYKFFGAYYYAFLPYQTFFNEGFTQLNFFLKTDTPVLDALKMHKNKNENENNFYFFSIIKNFIYYYFFGSLILGFLNHLSCQIFYFYLAKKKDSLSLSDKFFINLSNILNKCGIGHQGNLSEDLDNLNDLFNKDFMKNFFLYGIDRFFSILFKNKIRNKPFQYLESNGILDNLFLSFIKQYIYIGMLIFVNASNKSFINLKLFNLKNLFLNKIEPKKKFFIKFKDIVINSQSLRRIFIPKASGEKKILFFFHEIKSLLKKNKINFNKMPSYFLLIIGQSGKTTLMNIFGKYIEDSMNFNKIRVNKASFLGRVPELANRIKKNQLKEAILESFQKALDTDIKNKEKYNLLMIENVDSVLTNRNQSLKIDNYIILNKFLTVFNVAGEFDETTFSGFLIGTATEAKKIDAAALRRLKFIVLDFKDSSRLNRIMLMSMILETKVHPDYKDFFSSRNIKKDLKFLLQNLNDVSNVKFESIVNNIIISMVFFLKNIDEYKATEIKNYYEIYEKNKKYLLNNNIQEYKEAELPNLFFYALENGQFNQILLKEFLYITKR